MKLPQKLRNLFGTHGQIPPNKPNMPLFVTGCMRSGTTFLTNKLIAHPQLLKIGIELNKIWSEIGGASCLKECVYKNESDANGLYTYNMSNYFFEFIQESKSLKRHLMRGKILLEKKVGRVFYDWDNIIPVNKSPHLINKISYINALFPKAKILLIVRNIYAHSASMKFHFNKVYANSGRIGIVPKNSKDCWRVKKRKAIYWK